MCGRYALNLAPSLVRQMLLDQNMPVDDAPADEGDGAPRQSYNFAPGYHGIVYRADTPDRGAGQNREHGREQEDTTATDDDESIKTDVKHVRPDYKLQSMKWGLIPFWTKRNPDYGTIMRSINCRDDSLSTPGGMWATMKARKRCIVIAQGFFEWLRTGPKDKLPHFIGRKDGSLMCFAGLWDCVKYDDTDEKTYTYTVITTDSNEQMKFIHDRMPVILNLGSEEIRTWLDPQRHEWSKDLQSLLRPFEGELDIYPVSKEVGKVGNNSPSFIVPLDSKENKSNIANYFVNTSKKAEKKPESGNKGDTTPRKVKTDGAGSPKKMKTADDRSPQNVKTGGNLEISRTDTGTAPSKKRQPEPEVGRESPPKKQMTTSKKISATNNQSKTLSKASTPGAQKITKFFGNSA